MKNAGKIAIAAGIAYLLWEEYGSPFGVPTVGGSSSRSDPAKSWLDYCVGNADTVYKDGGFILADYMPAAVNVEAERARLLNNESAAGNTLGAAMWGFYNQIYLPASRVKDKDLYPYTFQLANGMLAGLLSRDDTKGRLYANLLNDVQTNADQAKDLAIAKAVVGAVAAIIPIVGGAISIAAQTGIQEGIKGNQQNIEHDLDAVNAVDKIKTGLGLGSPEAIEWLKNTEQPIVQKAVHSDNGIQVPVCSIGLTELGGFYYQIETGEPCGQVTAGFYKKTTTNGYTRDVFTFKPGYAYRSVACHMRLFSMSQYTWLLPWNSPNLSSEESVRRRIAIIAPVFRAFDRMICSQSPLKPPADGKGDMSRYWYHSPLLGTCAGSIFPPDIAAGDQRLGIYPNALGWHGESPEVSFKTQTAIESDFVMPQGPNTSEITSATDSIMSGRQTTDVPPTGEDYGQVDPKEAIVIAQASTTTVSTSTTATRGITRR